ncbi:MAG TPA: YciK family oxidoreductase [Pseudomonadales bacterium]|nr:YciK family oxidoreductase [Pseudomonadales bacterium]
MHNYVPPANLLTGRHILVTGASDGIGRAVALKCAQLGATVILLARSNDKLEQVYDEIEANGWPQPAIVPLHLGTTTEAQFNQLAAQLENEFGKLDGLVHCAAALGDQTLIEMYDPQTWRQVFDVNVNGAFMLTQSLLPLLRLSGDASIIFTSSSVGRKGRAHWGAYAVSKFAVEGLMQVLADELENTAAIKVNSINPGAVRTVMRATAYPFEDPANLRRPEEITDLYCYLLGPDSKGVSGQALDAQPK